MKFEMVTVKGDGRPFEIGKCRARDLLDINMGYLWEYQGVKYQNSESRRSKDNIWMGCASEWEDDKNRYKVKFQYTTGNSIERSESSSNNWLSREPHTYEIFSYYVEGKKSVQNASTLLSAA